MKPVHVRPLDPPRAFARVGSENRGLYRVIRGESI